MVDKKVMIGTEDGEKIISGHGTEMEKLAANDMGNAIYTTPAADNGVLFITSRLALFALQEDR